MCQTRESNQISDEFDLLGSEQATALYELVFALHFDLFVIESFYIEGCRNTPNKLKNEMKEPRDIFSSRAASK